jgi:hypothetical protein
MRAALAALVLCACDAPPPAPDAGVGELVIGTVDASKQGFLPMIGDQTLVAGAQGGFHIWLKYRVSGVAAGPVRVLRTVRRISDGRLILKTDDLVTIGPLDADGGWELPAPLPSFMCPTPIGVQVYDQPVRFDVTVTDVKSGATLADGTADATPRCPTADPAQLAFCLKICAG